MCIHKKNFVVKETNADSFAKVMMLKAKTGFNYHFWIFRTHQRQFPCAKNKINPSIRVIKVTLHSPQLSQTVILLYAALFLT